MLRNGQTSSEEEILQKTPFWEEWKQLTVKNVKKHGYTGLVATIRFYVRSSNFLKNKYQETRIKIKNIRAKNTNSGTTEKKEVNKFLKMISEYKNKIKKIKHRIKEEENL